MEQGKQIHDASISDGGFVFALKGYIDANRTTEIIPTQLASGSKVYMSLTASVPSEMEDSFRFTPNKCTFKAVSSDESVQNSFVLFDATVNSCQQEFSSLQFSLTYDSDKKSWDFSYLLFLFNGDVVSRYILECDVNACYGDEGMQTCKNVAEKCDSNYSENTNLWSGHNETLHSIMTTWPYRTRGRDDQFLVEPRQRFAFDDEYFYHSGRCVTASYEHNRGCVARFSTARNFPQTFNKGQYVTYHEVKHGPDYQGHTITDKFVIAIQTGEYNMHVFNKTTQQLIRTFPLASGEPWLVEIDEATNTVFVANRDI